jgi:hypothetical protein
MGIIHKIKHKAKKHKPDPPIPHVYLPKPHFNPPNVIIKEVNTTAIKPIDDHVITPIEIAFKEEIIDPIDKHVIKLTEKKVIEPIENTFEDDDKKKKKKKNEKPMIENDNMLMYLLLGGALISTVIIIM